MCWAVNIMFHSTCRLCCRQKTSHDLKSLTTISVHFIFRLSVWSYMAVYRVCRRCKPRRSYKQLFFLNCLLLISRSCCALWIGFFVLHDNVSTVYCVTAQTGRSFPPPTKRQGDRLDRKRKWQFVFYLPQHLSGVSNKMPQKDVCIYRAVQYL